MDPLLPWEIDPALALERLLFVARLLNEVHEEVARHIQPEKGDLRYGRWVPGTTEYARSAEALEVAAKSGEHSWLGIVDPSMQFVGSIGGVSFRFYHGDAETPSRSARKQAPRENKAQYEAFDLNEITKPDAGWSWRFAVLPDLANGGVLSIDFVQVAENGACRNAFTIPFRENIAPLSSVADRRPSGVDLPPPMPQEIPSAEETGTAPSERDAPSDDTDE